MNTPTLGQELAQLQKDLVTLWNTQGPDTVLEYLTLADPAVLRSLVMVNVGAQAGRTAR